MDFEKLIEYRCTHNHFMRRLGIEIAELSLDSAAMVKTVGPDDLNPLGYAHGGVYFTMADSAAGTAMATHGYVAVTMNATYNYFRSAAEGDVITARASLVKRGQTVSVYDVRVTDQNDTLLGTGTFTFYQLEEKIEL